MLFSFQTSTLAHNNWWTQRTEWYFSKLMEILSQLILKCQRLLLKYHIMVINSFNASILPPISRIRYQTTVLQLKHLKDWPEERWNWVISMIGEPEILGHNLVFIDLLSVQAHSHDGTSGTCCWLYFAVVIWNWNYTVAQQWGLCISQSEIRISQKNAKFCNFLFLSVK